MLNIISWNCQGAFRNKFEQILALKPDILIIIECEPLDKLKFGELFPLPNEVAWYSDDGKKGVVVLSFCDFKLELLNMHHPEFRYILPFRVYNNVCSFFMLAVWAMDNKLDPASAYIGQVWNAIHFYEDLLKEDCVLIGDFNSNEIWDVPDRVWNHSSVVRFLADRDIISLYHHHFNEAQGMESQKTFFLHRKLEKPYHIDYAFASRLFISDQLSVEVGRFDDWISLSDHVPIHVKLEVPKGFVTDQFSFLDLVTRDISTYSLAFRQKFAEEIISLQNTARDVDAGVVEKIELYRLLASFKKLNVVYGEIL